MTYIHLECGCQYNHHTVLAVCALHDLQLRQTEREAQQAHEDRMRRLVAEANRRALGKTAVGKEEQHGN
jgi:hypothetical protein